ncbi:cytochrome c-type biogenesis protein [Psychrobacter sp. HD31]|uniref:cytochrome c-type biogenesis protein n=1 Tax=Psychrobacter sp. HD31 TaxID=3112003 RepID=UPI003DA61525
MKRLFNILTFLFLTLIMIGFNAQAYSAIDVYQFESAEQQLQYQALIEELRCPKCQNQNLASSNSPISQDLKRKTYELVIQGKSDIQIRDYMKSRYGDFISYKPPVRPSTYLLWYLPPILLILALGIWFWSVRLKSANNKNANNVVDQPSALNITEKQQLTEILNKYDKPDGS